MTIVQINASCGSGSTGKICVGISEMLTQNQIENYILYCSGTSDYPLGIKCADDNYIKAQALKSHLLGNYGFNSNRSTQKMIAELERIQPDIVHLHNIHGHDCNLDILFHYFKEKHIELIWTFHDCWAFTAYCPHFTMAKCEKWKTDCNNCPQQKEYSWVFDRSEELYQKKKELFSGLDLTIVTPSQWLADLVKQSFLKDYPVKVINNGIDLSIFKPIPSGFRQKYGIPDDKYILLGVAYDWGIRKGLDVFVELAKRLPQEQYQIVLVGTNDKVDKQLSDNIISIHRTQNQQELAEIYTAADLFINPTREENYPTVNMESIACGTPVLTFNTGGSPEIINEKTGTSISSDNMDSMIEEIVRIRNDHPYSTEDCLYYAKEFDMNDRFLEYIKLYKEI